MRVKMFECSASSGSRNFVGIFPLEDILSANANAFSTEELDEFAGELKRTGQARLPGFVGAYAEFERIAPSTTLSTRVY
ncbi:hypothetical protein [Mesorhizobium sp. 1M-11]|uniref:hypothetical protein n=1 Tax=Mesorhizobium sp. 1M-11 TaxID=1529006 RepID=UPI0006C743F8|nr:hypothetical protein [Mesorhizobium sp. 1M-11]